MAGTSRYRPRSEGVQPVLARRRSDSDRVQAAQRGQRKQVAYHRRARLSRRPPRVQPHADEEHLKRRRTYEPADGEVRRTRPAIWPTSSTSVARGPRSVKHYVGFTPGRPGLVGDRIDVIAGASSAGPGWTGRGGTPGPRAPCWGPRSIAPRLPRPDDHADGEPDLWQRHRRFPAPRRPSRGPHERVGRPTRPGRDRRAELPSGTLANGR